MTGAQRQKLEALAIAWDTATMQDLRRITKPEGIQLFGLDESDLWIRVYRQCQANSPGDPGGDITLFIHPSLQRSLDNIRKGLDAMERYKK